MIGIVKLFLQFCFKDKATFTKHTFIKITKAEMPTSPISGAKWANGLFIWLYPKESQGKPVSTTLRRYSPISQKGISSHKLSRFLLEK